LPLVSSNGRVKLEPIAFLDRKIVKKNNQVEVEVLVQWSNLQVEDATWASYEELKQQFAIDQLEDKLAKWGSYCQHQTVMMLVTVG
jgi:cell division protein FtsL